MKAFNYGSLRKSLPLFVGLCAMGLQAGAAHARGWDHRDSLRADLNPLSQVPSVLAGSHGNLRRRSTKTEASHSNCPMRA